MIYTFVVKDSKNPSIIKRVLSLTVVTNATESWSANVLKTPVEKGFPITDHLNLNNGVFNISGAISEYSIYDNNRELRWNGSQFETVGQVEDSLLLLKAELRGLILLGEVFNILVSNETSLFSDPQERYEDLKRTKVEEFGDCCLANISFDDQVGTSGVLNVQMNIEKIQVAVVQIDQVSQEERTKALRRNEVNAGTVVSSSTNITQTPTEAATDKKTVEDERLPGSLDPNRKTQDQIAAEQARLNRYETQKVMFEQMKQINEEIEKTGMWRPLP